MSANPEEVWNIKATASGVSLAVGFIFPLAILAFNDPDRVKFSAAIIWFLIYLVPAAMVISVK